METSEHTFPVPETEAHKLDELKEELQNTPSESIRLYPVLSVIASLFLGFFIVKWIKQGRA
jgi:hypothetical protein